MINYIDESAYYEAMEQDMYEMESYLILRKQLTAKQVWELGYPKRFEDLIKTEYGAKNENT